MRILLAPDSFKGSLDARAVATSLSEGLGGEHDVTLLPLADGGEGSVDAALAAGFRPVETRVQDARGDVHDATLALSVDGSTAVVEVANTCGLALLEGRLAPLTASTRGVGEAVAAALALGASRIVVALGGSASTDGGTGLLRALGMRFLDGAGRDVAEGAGGLAAIRSVDASGLVDLTGVELVGATDVQSVLTGVAGAAAVFGPQKGLETKEIADVDAALEALVEVLGAGPGVLGAGLATAASLTPGSGAAGGTGFACLLLGGRLVSGADYFLDLLGFDDLARASDVIVTGEGCLDEQTLAGKLVSVVVRRSCSRPVVAVVGHSLLTDAAARAAGLAAVYALTGRTDGDPSTDPDLTRRLLVGIGGELRDSLGAETP